jgi:hypothetical protein
MGQPLAPLGQQNSYSKSAGVSGGSEDSTGVVGVSLRHPGVYGQVEDSLPVGYSGYAARRDA